MVEIIVDVHEKDSGNIERLEKLGVSVRVEPLEFGDYLLSDFFSIERKDINDLFTSLTGGSDHNVKLQLQNCRENFKVVVLAVIGDTLSFNPSPIKYAQIGKYLEHEEVFEGTIVKKFTTEDKFCKWMFDKATVLQTEKHTIDVPRSHPRIKDTIELQKFFYEGLVDTGIETAKLLQSLFPNPYNFIQWLKGVELIYTKGGNFKEIKTIGEPNYIKGLGEKWYTQNIKLVFGD